MNKKFTTKNWPGIILFPLFIIQTILRSIVMAVLMMTWLFIWLFYGRIRSDKFFDWVVEYSERENKK